MSKADIWEPTKVTRVVDFLTTSTKPIKAETDDGLALIKYIGNPQGCDALVAEFVAGSLARCVGIPVPDFAIINCPEIEIGPYNLVTTAGPSFASRWVPDAMSLAPDSKLLEDLREPSMITNLVVFDTWIRNFDRYSDSGDDTVSNLDNILFVPDKRKSAMIVIDHTHAFVESTFDEEMDDPMWWDDKTVYGQFPNFKPYLSHKALMNMIDKIMGVDIVTLEEIFAKLPSDWQLTQVQRSLFAEQLLKRAEALPNWLPEALFDQREMAF